MGIDLERRYKLLTAQDKRNAYQRAYQAKKRATRTQEDIDHYNAYQREWRAKRKANPPYYEKSIIEALEEAHEKRKAYQRAWNANKKAKLTPEQIDQAKEHRREYYIKNREKITSNAKRRLINKKSNESKSKKEIFHNEKRIKFIDSIITHS